MTVLIRSKEIGKGSYGVIFLSYEKEKEDKKHATKVNFILSNTDFNGSIQELDFLIRLKHPCVVKLNKVYYGDPFKDGKNYKNSTMDGILKPDPLHLRLDLAKCDLNHIIKNKLFSEEKLIIVMIQLLLGLEYIHSNKIIHRDVKPANILYGEDRYIKICDFGMSFFDYDNMNKSIEECQTSWYRAPEIALGIESYTNKIDIWSLGCVFYELMLNKPLFPLIHSENDTNKELLKKIASIIPYKREEKDWNTIVNKGKRFSKGPVITAISKIKEDNSLIKLKCPIFRDLLNNMLVLDPCKRYSTTECLNHLYFKNYRNYIENFKKEYPRVNPTNKEFRIRSTTERKVAANLLIKMVHKWLDNKCHIACITPEILFHSLECTDRYLNFCIKECSIKTPKGLNQESTPRSPIDMFKNFDVKNGYIDNVRLILALIIYINIKFFISSSSSDAYTFEYILYNILELENVKFDKKNLEKKEIYFLDNVFNHKIFNPTPLEYCYGYLANKRRREKEIVHYFTFYCKLPTMTINSYEDVMTHYLKFNKYLLSYNKRNNTKEQEENWGLALIEYMKKISTEKKETN